MNRLKKIGKFLLKAGIIGIVTFLLFELLFRWYIIDFYGSELQALNKTEHLEGTEKKTLLIFGDSFSADPRGYVGSMQDSLAGWNVINCAIPGISPKQMQLFFNDRIEEFQPDKVLIQLYVGNDFQDYHHLRNWSELSFTRNCYWGLSDRLMSLHFINYRLGGSFGKASAKKSDPKERKSFNRETYNHREQLYFRSEPVSLRDAVNGDGVWRDEYEDLVDDLTDFTTEWKGETCILIIPHGAQVTENYRKNMIQLGAKLPASISTGKFGLYDKLKKHFSGQKNIRVCTPLDVFRKTSDVQLYYPNDPHLTWTGHKRLYAYVLQQLNVE